MKRSYICVYSIRPAIETATWSLGLSSLRKTKNNLGWEHAHARACKLRAIGSTVHGQPRERNVSTRIIGMEFISFRIS